MNDAPSGAGERLVPDSRDLFWYRRWQLAPLATRALVVANVWIFLLAFLAGLVPGEEFLWGDVTMMECWDAVGALRPFAESIAEPTRFLTAASLHFGLLHLLMNMVSLYSVGATLERLVGSRALLLIYAASGLAGMGASSVWSGSLSVGASGAIFGIAWAVVMSLVRLRRELPPGAALRMGRSLVVLLLVLLILLPIASQLFGAPFDNAGHVGGSVMGGLLGLLAPRAGRGPLVRLLSYLTWMALAVSVLLPVLRIHLLAEDPITERLDLHLPRLREERIEPFQLRLRVPTSWQRETDEAGLPSWNWLGEPRLEISFEPAPVRRTPSVPGHVALIIRDFERQQARGVIQVLEVALREDLIGNGPGGYLIGFRFEVQGRRRLRFIRLLEGPAGAFAFHASHRGGEQREALLREVLLGIDVLR